MRASLHDQTSLMMITDQQIMHQRDNTTKATWNSVDNETHMQNEVSKLQLKILVKMKQAAASKEIRLDMHKQERASCHWTLKTFDKEGIEVVNKPVFDFFVRKV
ncbi:hypothetical protein IRJ41_011367 [Triplophysa rosa]|uniref:Uncharacterized protein n=1 Tax=Triplophysa rosa TaxID=992332 RepID=A0A9W7WAS5_TRIRA|nr:hypothetical protein IRJ41_011367 [Triplophysa rosa]